MRYSISTIILLLFATVSIAQKTDSPTSDKQSEIRKNIYEKVNLQLSPAPNAAAIKQAILVQKPLIQNLGSDLLLESEIESPGGKHFDFKQTLAGIPIYQAGIKANVTKSGRIISFLNNLKGFSGSAPSFQHTSADLQRAALAKYNEGATDFQIFANSPTYLLENEQLRAVHLIRYTSNTMTWELLLDDVDLEEVLRRDLAAYRKPLAGTTTDSSGIGMVFMPDPLTSAGQVYGGAYVDNNDADSPELNNQRVQVVLRDINWTGTEFELKGPYVDLQDREAPTTAIATSTTGDFSFTRTQSGFEDVMVYYHIDTFQRYIQSLGFLNLQNGPVIADPHGLNLQDNSHFIPQGIDSRLGFGEGGVDDAEDADVIIHEYGHALSYAGSPGTNSGTERQGLDEGIGDYFAASYSKGLSFTFWKNTFTWDGHNEFWPGRSASDPTLYPPSNPNIYIYGSIWASTLMEVYDVIGKTASDKVVLQSLYGNGGGMSLSDAAMVVLEADSLLFGGAHHDQYQNAFCARGILNGVLPGQGCWVTADAPQSDFGDWTLFPNPANDQIQVQIKGFSGGKTSFSIVDLLGRSLLVGQINTNQSSIDIGTLPAGTYIFRLSNAKGEMDARRIVIAR